MSDKALAIAPEAANLPAAPVSESSAVLNMIERASRDPSVDIEKFERLMLMKERTEASTARREFNQAIAEAKAEIEPVVRNKAGHTGRYADFSAIARAVDHPLSRHGLSYRFRTAQADNKICVTCILSHRDGHAEETTLAGPADTSGSKNAVQAIGSTLTYLQRYTLMQSIGLAATDDDDGHKSGSAAVSDEQIERLQALIVEVGADIPRFLKYFKAETLADLPAKQFDAAVVMLESKRAKGG